LVCVGQDVCIGAGIEQGDYLGGEAVLCGVDQFAIECLRRGDLRLEGFVFSIDDGNDFESVQGQENGADDQDDARKGTAFLVVSMVRSTGESFCVFVLSGANSEVTIRSARS